jgi:hypothetical protein
MCGLRDVLEVFGDFGASVLGLGRSLRAGICGLRDVSEVFSRSRRVWIVPASDNVSFARRFGGVRRIRPMCLGLGRSLRVGRCGLRDVSGVFCRIRTCFEAFAPTSVNVSFARRFGGVSLKIQMRLGVFSLTGVNV